MEIKACLNILGLNQKNNGTSTEKFHFQVQNQLRVFPLLMAKKLVPLVKLLFRITTKSLKLQPVHLNFGESFPPQREEKLFDNLEIV
jgi:hypothetical protein